MSFTNAPVTRWTVTGLVSMSILASLLDIKHYFYILIDVHLWRYRQLWRLLTYQLCYTNSAELLFAAMSIYNLRVVERMWGTRKFASFMCVSYVLTSLVTPILMAVFRPFTLGLLNYVPAGPTPIIFAILAQFHAMVPQIYKYRIATSAAPPTNETFSGITFSDKSYKYALAIHLSLLQWPGSVIGAFLGWVIGYSWREGVLPSSFIRWRVPSWLVGQEKQRRAGEFEGLRRRLEGESTATATATGAQGSQAQGQPERRRTMGQQFVDQFRDVL